MTQDACEEYYVNELTHLLLNNQNPIIRHIPISLQLFQTRPAPPGPPAPPRRAGRGAAPRRARAPGPAGASVEELRTYGDVTNYGVLVVEK